MSGNRICKKKVVVVGGGTAGLVVAEKLQRDFDVVVIDKAKYKKYPFLYGVPLMIGLLFRDKKSDYIKEREIVLGDGRVIPFFESNIFGGASVMNGCAHVLGGSVLWNRVLEKFNATYADVIASFEDLYHMSGSGRDIGRISILTMPKNEVDRRFISGLKSMGVGEGDMNYADVEQCGSIYMTTKKRFRSSVLSIWKGKGKKNVIYSERVVGLILGGNGAVKGVKTNRRIVESDYVIISGGVIGTNDLMLRFKDEYKNKMPGMVKSLDVGTNVKDHTNLRVNVLVNKNIGSLNEVDLSIWKKGIMLVRHLLGLPTLMRGTGASSTVHLDLDDDGVIDTRINVVNFSETGRHGSDGNFFDREPGFSLSITAISPKSTGKIELNGGESVVDPKYLSSGADVELLRMALVYCVKLLRSSPLNEIVREIVSEREMIEDPEGYITKNIYSGHHLIGGMYDSVDSEFQVKGIPGLYVCDASILRDYPASNIHSSVVVLAGIFSNTFRKLHSSAFGS